MNDVEEGIRAEMLDSAGALSVTNSRLTTFRTEIGIGTDSVGKLLNDVEEGIRSDIRSDSDILSITNSRLTAFRTDIGLGTDSSVSSLINDVQGEIEALIILDSAGIATIANQAVTTFKTGLFGGEYDSEGEFAIAQQGLIQQSTANSDGLASVNQKHFVSLDNNNHFAGFELNNNGVTSSFILTADKFKVVNGSSNVSPFEVDNGVVKLSNATVTGQLDIFNSDAGGAMSITNQTITITDAGNNPRVRFGKLS